MPPCLELVELSLGSARTFRMLFAYAPLALAILVQRAGIFGLAPFPCAWIPDKENLHSSATFIVIYQAYQPVVIHLALSANPDTQYLY